ncbi:MAG TPA: MtrB/PioB family outer membrane beta-barrel protein [Acidobacteriota bacterium]
MRSDQTDRPTPILRVDLAFLACVVSALMFTHVWCQTQQNDTTQTQQKNAEAKKPPLLLQRIQASFEIGGQTRDTQGGHPAKFQEARDVPKGLYVQKLSLDFRSDDSPYFVSLRGFEIRELDQRFKVDVGRFGKYRTQFVWDQVPHSFGSGRYFFQRTAPGIYQVSPTLRARLQAATTPDTAPIAPNAELPTIVRQELQTAAITDVRLRRDQALLKQDYWASDNVELHFQLSRLRNRGSRPISAGTFVRRPGPAPARDGLWEGLGQELPEPIDHRTTDLNLGTQFSGKQWNAGVDYDLSLFRNHIGTLLWENPFRITDEQGIGATNRFRMVRWQTDLAPNNNSHSVSFRGNVDLTRQTQLRGLLSLAYWTQNDDFLPWTLNTAIVPKSWNAATPIDKPTDVNSLPARSLNGKMRNVNQDYALVNRAKNFRFQLQYRSQDLNNQTRTIEFPGYGAFGDSTWRTAATDFFGLPIENPDQSFTRQNTTAGFQWDILPRLTWKLDYGWEIWNRNLRDANRTNEHSIRGRLDLTPGAGIQLKADYRYSDRRPRSYNTQPLSFNPAFAGSPANGPQGAWEVTPNTRFERGVPTEFNLLRRFDESGRIRNDGSLSIDVVKGDKTNFSASYRYLRDDHDKNFYGRHYTVLSFIDAQFSYASEGGSFFYANYSREMNRLGYRGLAHLLIAAAAPPGVIVQGTTAQFPIANTWDRSSRSNLDSFQFGINSAAQEGKLQVDLSYALSFARDRIDTVNPFPIRADSVLNAQAFPYPDTLVRRQDVNIVITRQLHEGLEVGARYWYEPYTQDDFSFNVLQPYVHGNITSDAPKYLFLDSRYASYHANVATVFLRYSF